MNPIEDIYGLTPAQEGMYYQFFRDNHTDAYHLYDLFSCNDEVDFSLLKQTIFLLALRHPVLKTAFAVADGVVKQVILSNRRPATVFLTTEAAFSENELDTILRNEKEYRFDLLKDPLVRCVFIQFSDKRFLLVHTHHLIADGWSMSVLFSDLLSYYNKLAQNTDAEMLAKQIEEERKAETPFSEYVNMVRAADAPSARKYWLNLLAGGTVCALPKDFSKQNSGFKYTSSTISRKLRRQTDEFARNCRISVNTVFECVFSLVLQKYSGEKDIIFNKVISGKNVGLPNIERTFGPMLNTVPLRACCENGISPYEYLCYLHNQSVKANESGFLPFADIYRSCGIDPGSIEILFAFENYELSVPDDTVIRPLRHIEQTEFPLTVNLIPVCDEYRFDCIFDSGCFNASTVASIQNSFISVLSVLTSYDDISLNNPSNLSGLTGLLSDEKEKILNDFNKTAVSYDSDKSIYELFLKQVEKNNQKAVITDGNTVVPLSKLASDAAVIDAYIRCTAGPGKHIIGVICDRSYTELALIYGIIRGGNAYLPIFPRFPEERIRTMLGNSGCSLVLAQKCFAHIVEGAISAEDILNLSTDVIPPEPASKPDDTLYVIYTSGSTGTPKGAMVSNRSAVNRIEWMAKKYFSPDTVVMRKTPFTFDVSVWEIFGFALSGFSLYILPPEEHYNQKEVLSHIEKGGVTDIHFVPSVFSQFLAVLRQEPEAEIKLRSLKHVILSGECLQAKEVNEFRRFHDGLVTVHNLYGPTECAVDVTAYDCKEYETDPIPIGKPIDNTKIYIVNTDMQPVPVGVKGELLIAGDCVGKGYLNCTELTNSKFIDNPFGESKIYKTGDLAFYREDGCIVFAGRNDYQVKINGQRIEPGEIEVALSLVKGIESSVVIVLKDENERQSLCAFYTGIKNTACDLKTSLGKTLPAYMIPQTFIHLDRMPLNASGKIDRSALTKITVEKEEGNQKTDPPQNRTETEICLAFMDVLKVEYVGRTESFYELGGTSLDIIKLLSKEPLSALKPADFMENPTPAALAEKITAQYRQTQFLRPLYVPKYVKKALVLFSYGGGDATAYTALVSEFKKNNKAVSLYYIQWLDEQEIISAAGEIRELAKTSTVYFYSHCAGAATALKLLDTLNVDETVVPVLIAGGNVLPAFRKKSVNIWKNMTDSMILRFLKSAGFPSEKLTNEEKSEIVSRFRTETDSFFEYIREKTEPTRVSVDLILSKNDPFTRNYRSAVSRWTPYVSKVLSVKLTDSKSHYFQSTESGMLYEYLINKLKEG